MTSFEKRKAWGCVGNGGRSGASTEILPELLVRPGERGCRDSGREEGAPKDEDIGYES